MNFLIKEKKKFLKYLQEALTDENPDMYENGIRILGNLIDNQKVLKK